MGMLCDTAADHMVTGPTHCIRGLTPSVWQKRFPDIFEIVLMHAAGLWDPEIMVSHYWDHRAILAKMQV